MAIDASISLQGLGAQAPAPQSAMDTAGGWMKLAQVGQNIAQSKQAVEASKASQALTEAQTPGAAADSAMKVRQNEALQYAQNNKSEWNDVDPVTGATTPNLFKAAATLGKGGYLDEAKSMLGSHLSQQYQEIQNAQGNVQTESQKVALAQAQNKLQADTVGAAANVLSNIPEGPERDAQAGTMVQNFNKTMPGTGDIVAQKLTKTVPVVGADGKPVIDPATGQPQTKTVANGQNIEGYKKATIDASTQFNNDQTQLLNKATLERYGQSPESYDPNSSLSSMARQALTKQGINVAPNANYRDLLQTYGPEKLASLGTNEVVSQEFRLDAKSKAAAAQTDISNINVALSSANNYSPTVMGTKVGTFIGSGWDNLVKQNPSLASLKTAVQTYNARMKDDPIDPATMSVGQIIAKLDTFKTMRQNDLVTNVNNMGPNINSGTAPEGAASPPAAGGTPSAGPQAPQRTAPTMRQDGKVLLSKAGKQMWFPPANVSAAKADGWN